MKNAASFCAFLALTALVAAQSRDEREVVLAVAQPAANARAARLGPDAALVPVNVLIDDLGRAHARYRQTVRGLPVFEGDAIVHVDVASGSVLDVTDATLPFPVISTRATLDADAALYSARRHFGLAAGFSERASLILVVERAVGILAWQVRVTGESANGPIDRIAVIDAHGGGVLRAWDNVETAAASGTGLGFFSGAVKLTTGTLTSGFELRDPTRGGQYTVDMRNRQTGGRVFTDANNAWGDGALSHPQAIGVDAQYGAAMTWDYFFTRHHRRGIANDGRGIHNRVHYGRHYNNAFWSDSCFCLTFGDGDGVTFNPFDSLDVMGHEMAHGVTRQSANLTYAGESGAISEATSDIFGTMVEHFADNPNDPPDYRIGEGVYRHGGGALRNMIRPSSDGRSADCWFDGVGSLDVHHGSGVGNHFYYLLAEGTNHGSPSPTCAPGDTRVATGTGTLADIGTADAERIWYRALTVYMTAGTTYSGARVATRRAADDLFGPASPQSAAVAAAWSAVGVR